MAPELCICCHRKLMDKLLNKGPFCAPCCPNSTSLKLSTITTRKTAARLSKFRRGPSAIGNSGSCLCCGSGNGCGLTSISLADSSVIANLLGKMNKLLKALLNNLAMKANDLYNIGSRKLPSGRATDLVGLGRRCNNLGCSSGTGCVVFQSVSLSGSNIGSGGRRSL